ATTNVSSLPHRAALPIPPPSRSPVCEAAWQAARHPVTAQAFPLIPPVRGHLDIGVQGKPVDTGTAGTAQERSLPVSMSWSEDTNGELLSHADLRATLSA